MIDPAILLPYIAACLLFSIVPGPSVTIVVANSLVGGTRAGLATILGTELSMLSMVFIVALGLEAVMALVSDAFTVIKLVGAAYLIWIGFRSCRSAATSGRARSSTGPIPRRCSFWAPSSRSSST
jgi:homoserine/homoserine lactone efflux protein